MKTSDQLGNTSKPPISLYIFAILCFVLGYFISADLLISLGPMRLSLTSDIESVRKFAYAEVSFFKIALFILAFLLSIIAITWGRIQNSFFIRSINARKISYKNIRNHQSLLLLSSCILVGVLYMMLGSYFFSPAQLIMINSEDGLIEYMSVLFFIICFLLSSVISIKLYRQNQLIRAVMHTILAVTFFLMVGEEISWGQRIFNLKTLEILKQANVQDENNFHNLFGYFIDHLFIAAILIYGFVLPFVAHFKVFYRKLFDFMGVPIASLDLAIGFLIVSMHQRWIVYFFISPPPGFRIEELRELLVAIALSLLMYESWQLLTNDKKTDVV